VPVAIRRALDRMMPMIRFLQHGDGRLALFNGGTESSDGWAHALLTYDSGRNKTQLTQACGYSRIVCGDTLLIADAGLAPKGLLSAGAHAGGLSFELSAGEERFVFICGASLIKGAHWSQAMRATAAHSTLSVADTSSAHVVVDPWAARLLGARLVDGPTRVEAKRRESEDGIHLDASHDGYLAPFGLIHERRWFVSHDGNDIRGEDRLVPNEGRAPQPFAIRFHLHPAVKAMRLPDGRAIVLTLPSGATWRFGADSPLDIADSVYLGTGDAIRKTQQILIAGTTRAEPAAVKWALKKITGATADTLVN
jgi:uncharacterized heparinase superfamily protein